MHWVAAWGTATSISDRTLQTYAKDLTLRYPIRMPFAGTRLRLRLSNLTGTEPVTISELWLQHGIEAPRQVATNLLLPPGEEVETPTIDMSLQAGETLVVSLYLADYTQMNAGTLVTGPLSGGQFAYGRFPDAAELPRQLSRSTNWYYFLNTIDLFTASSHHALICYGDSITAQSWPDYLALRAAEEGGEVSIIRRAVCGTRILRQYDCITYAAYGLQGATRFPIETHVAGAKAIIIQHGINDIIHPVGVEVNPFRPWSDMPTLDDLIRGTEQLYLQHAAQLGLTAYLGTLLPIYGWRTYTPERDALRMAFNDWMRQRPSTISPVPVAGCIDFDATVRHPQQPEAFASGFDSGDHLHPSEAAYKAMAAAVPVSLLH